MLAVSSATSTLPSADQRAAATALPGQLPAALTTRGNSASTNVSLSAQGQALLAQQLVNNPVATAAVSNNQQVDKVADTIYTAQSAARLGQIYTGNNNTNNQNSSSNDLLNNPVAVAAVSDNSKVDQLADTIYASQNAQSLLNTYQNAQSGSKGTQINSTY